MDLEKQAAKLNKKIEKLKTILTDGTALSWAQRTAETAEKVPLQAQLAALQNQLQSLKIIKINVKHH